MAKFAHLYISRELHLNLFAFSYRIFLIRSDNSVQEMKRFFFTVQTLITKAAFVLFAVGSNETDERVYVITRLRCRWSRSCWTEISKSFDKRTSLGGGRSICRILWRNSFRIEADAVACFRRILVTPSRCLSKDFCFNEVSSSLFVVDTLKAYICAPTNNQI